MRPSMVVGLQNRIIIIDLRQQSEIYGYNDIVWILSYLYVIPHSFIIRTHRTTTIQINIYIYFTHYNIIKVNENTSAAGRRTSKSNEPQISYEL